MPLERNEKGMKFNMENIFENPKKYIQRLQKIQLIDTKRSNEFSGKSIAVIFLTKYCNADCKFCIYKSSKGGIQEKTKENELNEIGIQRSIDFINSSNIGYLLISGGGEPFFKINHIFTLIKYVNVKDIVIVSNGFWGNNYDKALEILSKIEEIQKERHIKITIRISIDKWHAEKLKTNHIKNIIDIFSENFDLNENFKLKIHTIKGDNTILEVIGERDFNIKYQEEYSSDNKVLNKSNRHRMIVKFVNGYELEIEFAKLFNANLEVDLNNDINEQFKVFNEDLFKSQEGNFSTVLNSDNTKGLDYLINYNGNISTWANYQTYNSPNIYFDNCEDIRNKIYGDVISYSFLRETFENIIKIVEEVNPLAVKRAIGINIRDYFGMYLLYEYKTLLYYYIKILKKYIHKDILINIDIIPIEIIKTIELDDKERIELYRKSKYNIFSQYQEKEFNEYKWRDLFFLIDKGHFEVNEEQIKEGLYYYNEKTNQRHRTYKDIIINSDSNRYRRLLEMFNA